MNCIDLMKEEHQNILKLLSCMDSACCRLLEGGPVDDGDFRAMLGLARSYADRHHHGKEEQILFRAMTDHLGPLALNLIQHGMLVEHDLGRLHMMELEQALDAYQTAPTTPNKLRILAQATGYANLLRRHIDKEDAAVYSFAARSLPAAVMADVTRRIQTFEADAAPAREENLRQLRALSAKYCPEN